MIRTTVPIKGMHCKSCTILVEQNLSEIPGVKNTKVSLKNQTAEIFSKQPLDQQAIAEAVRKAGYQVGQDETQPWISTNPDDYVDLGLSLFIFILLYLLLNQLGLANISIGQTGNYSSLPVVLLIGLTAGISTCMAMVGGLVLGISARHAEKFPAATSAQKFRPHLFFNLGRIISYALLGGLIGIIGQAFQFSGTSLGILTIAIGIVMLILGLKLTELFPKISHLSLTLPTGLSKFLGVTKQPDQEYSHLNSALMGALTFFLPCGFTQAMQLYAMTTGSFTAGALIMGTFAIGTAPGLLGIGGLTSIIKGGFAKKFFKFAGVVVIALAIFNIGNGYNLTGWSFDKDQTLKQIDDTDLSQTNVVSENGVQIARMNQNVTGYTPNKFVIKKGLPVKWIITSTAANSCASTISLPKFNILKSLKAGENVIEFTPTSTGTLKFTCGMGMYPGTFQVID